MDEAVFERLFWSGLLLVFLFRVLALLTLPLDLSGDEAYYWEWGQHLDWGYYSKPPGIGWLMALAGWIGRDTVFGIRIFAVLLGTGSILWVYWLAKRMYDARVGLIAALAFTATPLNAGLNVLLTIDAPLMFFWTGSLYLFWRFVETQMKSLPIAVALTLMLAGGMLSKQMMLGFPFLAVAFLGLSQAHRSLLKKPSLWIVFLASLISLAPPLWWNSRHDWITIQHTAHHFETGEHTLGRTLARFFEFVGSQLGLITPVIFLLMLALIVVSIRYWKRLGDKERFLFLFSGPALLIMVLMTLRQRINGNWPAVFYASATIFVAAWGCGKISLPGFVARLRNWFAPGLRFAIGLAAAAYLLIYAIGLEWIDVGDLDVSGELRGWKRIASDIQSIRQEVADPENTILITVSHRYLNSTLAFYLPDHPLVYPYRFEPGGIKDQHDFWETPAARLGDNAIIIHQSNRYDFPNDLRGRFAEIEELSTLEYPDLIDKYEHLKIYLGKDLKHWP